MRSQSTGVKSSIWEVRTTSTGSISGNLLRVPRVCTRSILDLCTADTADEKHERFFVLKSVCFSSTFSVWHLQPRCVFLLAASYGAVRSGFCISAAAAKKQKIIFECTFTSDLFSFLQGFRCCTEPRHIFSFRRNLRCGAVRILVFKNRTIFRT